MASNVFGAPITDQYVKELPEYESNLKDITQKDRARVALLEKNADGKDLKARKFVETLRERLANSNGDNKIIAMCLIYNATGAPLTFVDHYTWSGRLAESPMPSRIENGQWGAFVTLREKIEGDDYKARACVVYAGHNSAGSERHWLLSWSVNRKSTNQVYTEISAPGEYKGRKWEDVDVQLSRNVIYHWVKMEDGLVFGMIGNDTSSLVEGIFTLPDAWFSSFY